MTPNQTAEVLQGCRHIRVINGEAPEWGPWRCGPARSRDFPKETQ